MHSNVLLWKGLTEKNFECYLLGFFHNSTYLSEMKFKVPLCYTSYITIGSPKWFIQCHKKRRSGRKQQKDLSPLQMKSWGTIWPQRKPLRALYSVQVLEVQHQSHVTILPDTFVFYCLLASICSSPFLSGERPVAAACYSWIDLFTQSGWYWAFTRFLSLYWLWNDD